MKKIQIKQIVDELFEDCNKIADKYETNLLTVLELYTTLEQKYQNINLPYKTIINKTEQHFKCRLYQTLKNEKQK